MIKDLGGVWCPWIKNENRYFILFLPYFDLDKFYKSGNEIRNDCGIYQL